MRRLSAIGSRNLAHNRGRSALTALGIVLGVAILFGVVVSNDTTNTGVDKLLEDFTGKADVLVGPAGAFDARQPASLASKLRGLPDVRVVSPGTGIAAQISSEKRKVTIGVRGVTVETERDIQVYDLAHGRFLAAGADEVVVPEKLAARLGVRVGSMVKLTTTTGERGLRLVGTLKARGPARSAEVAFTSLSVVQALEGRGDVFAGAAIVLRDGVSAKSWIAAHQAEVTAAVSLTDASNLAGGFRDFLKILQTFFTFFAATALFVGAFLIYLTLSMAVVERTRMYGTLRALGATRRQVTRLVVSESLVLGTVASIAGLGLGLGIARGLLVLVGKIFRIELHSLTVRPAAVITAFGVGVVVTLVSSFVPAVRAGRLAPVEAMRGDPAAQARLGRGWIAGVVGVVVALVSHIGAAGPLASGLGTLALMLGAVLLVPLLLRPVASLLGKITGRLARGVGDVAVLHLVKERSRSAYTLGLIMVVMAMVFAIGGVYKSMGAAIDTSLDRQFGADLAVNGRELLSPEARAVIESTRGVEAVTPIWYANARRGDERLMVQVIDPDSYFKLSSFPWATGDDESVAQALRRGGSVIGIEASGRRSIRLTTAGGRRTYAYAGTIAALGGPQMVVMGIGDGRKDLGVDRPSTYQVKVAQGASVAAVARRIVKDGDRFGLQAVTPAKQKAEARREFARYFQIIYAILAVAAIVGLLGLANTLAVSTVRRYREIGILRAIGVTRPGVKRMVLVESATMSLVAFALSLPLGSLLSVLVVRDTNASFGMDVKFLYPSGWIGLIGAFGALVAVLAAIAPGRRAARLQVVEALQYE